MAIANRAGPYDLDVARDMQAIAKNGGVTLGKQVGDFLALRLSGAGLSFEEYIYYGLYSRERSEYGAYMGDHRARAAFYVANDLRNWDNAEDKIEFHDGMMRAGIKTPRILAVAHATREATNAVTLRSQGDIRSWLESCALPVFGKPAQASHGDGAVKIMSRQGSVLRLADGECAIDEILSDIEPYASKDGYVFQEMLTPHPVISAITDGRIATLRLLIWLGRDGAAVREAVLRIPAGAHFVDNFRRGGNLISYVDRCSGALGPACRGVGVNKTVLDAHPDSAAQIAGTVVPDFDAATDLAKKAASEFPNLHIQSWDVALTDEGPSLLEVNPGGNLNVIQLAAGRGVFDSEFRDFLQWCVAENAGAKSNAKALKEARKLLKLK